MIPTSLSASALQMAMTCPGRYEAEYINKVKMGSGRAANLGTVVHSALEDWVQEVYVNGDKRSLEMLLSLYRKYYQAMFGDLSGPEYADGVEMLESWYDRSDYIDEGKVLSCEIKESFDLPTSSGKIPVNYIWDRSDQLGDSEYRVVDYKTIRVPASPDDLRTKVQPRIYALAAQIKWPKAERIWVEFDHIRYDRVGRVFTKEENTATWYFLKEEAEKILAYPDPAPRHVNKDCRYCPIKAGCPELMKYTAGGYVLPSLTVEQAAVELGKVQAAQKALEILAQDLDAILISHAEEHNILGWSDTAASVKISARKTRSIDVERAIKVIGPDLVKRYGSLNMRSVDKLLKGTELDPAQKRELQSLIYENWGDPHAKVELRGSIDGIDE